MNEIRLEFSKTPDLLPIYLRLLFGRRGKMTQGQEMPRVTASLRGMRVNQARLAAYNLACGFPAEGNLPMPYPFVMTFSMHMAMMAREDFPMSALGVVHQRNHIFQYRPIQPKESLDATCTLGDSRVNKNGIEFDIVTEIRNGHRLAWECISAYLARQKFERSCEPAALAHIGDLEAPNLEASWHVPGHMGWRYARITGDYNPIHVSSLLARLFGFRKAIIHGMWSFARALSQLPQLSSKEEVRCDLHFKGPVFIGSSVTMKARTSPKHHRFDLFCSNNPRPVLKGEITSGDRVTELRQNRPTSLAYHGTMLAGCYRKDRLLHTQPTSPTGRISS